MTMIDSSASTRQPAGAGKTVEYGFPDPYQVLLTSSSVTQMRNRLNGSTLAAVTGGFGGGGATLPTLSGSVTNGSIVRGPCVTMGGNGAGIGQLIRFTNGPFVYGNVLRTKTSVPAGADDYGVTNVSAIYAMDSMVGSASVESGLEITQNGGFLIAGQAGFGFLRPSLNVVQFYLMPVTSGAPIVTTVTPAGWDESNLNKYQLIFQAANATTDASITALLNGAQVAKASWTLANLGVTMPDLGASNMGMVPQIVWGQNGRLNLKSPYGFQVAIGPTVADTM